MNAEKQLRTACLREIPVVVQWIGEDGQRRQTAPVRVDLVTPDGEAWLVPENNRRGNVTRVDCASVTLIHPQIEEE